MRHPILRALIPVVLGVFLFAFGFWAGFRKALPTDVPSASGSTNRTSFQPGFPLSPDRFPEGAGGGSAGGAALSGLPVAGSPLPLERILENPDRRLRERELEARGVADFVAGIDWRVTSNSIGDLVDRGVYLRGVVSAWAADDPAGTVAYLSTLSLSARSSLIPHAVSIWAGQDPVTAESWVLALDNGEAKDLAIESLYRSWAVKDAGTAADRALTLANDPVRFRALAAVVQEWSANDLAGVEAWASDLEDPNLKDFAIMAVADEMSVRSPKEAMRWASDHLAKDPQANPEIVSLVASKAGFETPRETFDWLKTVPPSPEATSSLAGVATYLVEEDPDFAWSGFAKLPEDLKQVTAAPVASTLGSQDPESGKRWLGQLPDGEMKRWATSAFTAGWASRDPTGAEAWVATLPAGPEKEAATEGLTSADRQSGSGGREP